MRMEQSDNFKFVRNRNFDVYGDEKNMIFHYADKYNGDESSLPYKEHHPNATPFKEPEDTKKLSLIANGGCILIMGILAIPFLILGIEYIPDNAIWMMIGGICGGLSLLPHELLYNFLSDILKTWKRNRAILQSCIAHGFLEMCD